MTPRLRPRPMRALDERLGFASMGRKALAKVFPDHWSYLLGEVALYSFLVLVVTGVYLGLFFEPSSAEVVYDGSYEPLRGRVISAAYNSSVELSWDVRGGLLLRQTHHWAAHIFLGAIVLHLCRIFFTGAFRKPRELNWTIGLTMLILAIFNAYAGYSLPDDLLSGTGLRIFHSIMESIPVVGSWLTFLFFGEQFPGDAVLERLYLLHVFIVPAVLAALIAAHLAILVRQKHTHFPGPGRRDSNVVGSRVWPAYALRSLSLLCVVASVSLLAGGLVEINPVWVWGYFEPTTITAPSVADWYILWVEGGLRLFPPVEFRIFGHLVPNQFWAGAFLPAVVFLTLYSWPWIERRITGDRGAHHLSGRPREVPWRVGVGAGAIMFFAVLLAAGAQELWVQWTRWDVDTVRTVLRIAVLTLPLLVGLLAGTLARALKRSGRPALMEMDRHDVAGGFHSTLRHDTKESEEQGDGRTAS